MYVIVVGLNHKVAPVATREQLVFANGQLPLALQQFKQSQGNAVFVSTCNRTEVYTLTRHPHLGYRDVRAFLSSTRGLRDEDFSPYLYTYAHERAVRHLFSVASGIDSMILGEPQILGQVREALDVSLRQRAAGKVLGQLFRQAITVGKRARTETGIGLHAASVSYAAVELARKIFGELRTRRVFVVGAGEMAELVARTLMDSGCQDVIFANRTRAHAEELAARYGGTVVDFDSLAPAVARADIVITSTGAPRTIIGPDEIRPGLRGRRGRPLFLVDIAVPRDVDPAVQKLDNVFLYDIDDLQSVTQANLRERAREVEHVSAIVEEEVEAFLQWFATLEVVPTIVALRQRAEHIRQTELARAVSILGELSEGDRQALDALTQAIVNKLLHEPTVRLKRQAKEANCIRYAETVRDLFGLSGGAQVPGDDPA